MYSELTKRRGGSFIRSTRNSYVRVCVNGHHLTHALNYRSYRNIRAALNIIYKLHFAANNYRVILRLHDDLLDRYRQKIV